MNRRQMCKITCASAGLFALLGTFGTYLVEDVPQVWEEGSLSALSASDAQVVKTVARAILTPEVAGDKLHWEKSLNKLTVAVDQAIAGLPFGMREELQKLFELMGSRVLMGLSGGTWTRLENMTTEDVATFLNAWRFASFELLRSAYQALHELIMAAWYGQEEAWAAINYPGPPFARG